MYLLELQLTSFPPLVQTAIRMQHKFFHVRLFIILSDNVGLLNSAREAQFLAFNFANVFFLFFFLIHFWKFQQFFQQFSDNKDNCLLRWNLVTGKLNEKF